MSARDHATPKMAYCISLIEENLEIKYSGTTFEEASDFISNNLDKSKQAARMRKQGNREMWSQINAKEDITHSGLVPADVNMI